MRSINSIFFRLPFIPWYTFLCAFVARIHPLVARVCVAPIYCYCFLIRVSIEWVPSNNHLSYFHKESVFSFSLSLSFLCVCVRQINYYYLISSFHRSALGAKSSRPYKWYIGIRTMFGAWCRGIVFPLSTFVSCQFSSLSILRSVPPSSTNREANALFSRA